jgi:hypothetical protein
MRALLLLAFLLPAEAAAAPSIETKPAALFTQDMTEQEVAAAIQKAMPYPVVSVVYAVKDDRRHFAVNMRISGKSEPVFNVSWHVPVSADLQLMIRAISAAGEYARTAALSIK